MESASSGPLVQPPRTLFRAGMRYRLRHRASGSIRTECMPTLAAMRAAAQPAGPPPMMIRSVSWVMGEPVWDGVSAMALFQHRGPCVRSELSHYMLCGDELAGPDQAA